MTSTPVDDIAITLEEAVDAIGYLENNKDVEDNVDPEEERVFTVDEFKAAIDVNKGMAARSNFKFLLI
jgi:hypothetical protein